ncbi:MAG: ketosteroid isomerase-related protein [Hyphomonas sp.]
MTDTAALVARYYAAFNAKDWAGMAACVSEDIEHFVNEGGKRGGREAFAEFIAHMDNCYDETLTDIVVMATPDGARASAEFIVNGVYKKTDAGLPEAKNQTYHLPAGAFFDVKDGAITRVTTYYNLGEWIRQVS